jgi:hypothetical protein
MSSLFRIAATTTSTIVIRATSGHCIIVLRLGHAKEAWCVVHDVRFRVMFTVVTAATDGIGVRISPSARTPYGPERAYKQSLRLP